jgi:hypothetical protein
MASKTICSVVGCGKPVKGFGLCSAHYTRNRRHGSPEGGGTRKGAHVEFIGHAITFNGDACLIWPYTRNKAGYATTAGSGHPTRLVHRVVCENVHGLPPSPDHQVAHSCGKGHEGCVNPRHLRWATRLENDADKIIHGTRASGERHGAAKISDADVRDIRRLALTIPQKVIAKRYGISRAGVCLIVARKTWAHVSD